MAANTINPIIEQPGLPPRSDDQKKLLDDFFGVNSDSKTENSDGSVTYTTPEGGSLTVFGEGTAAPKKITGDALLSANVGGTTKLKGPGPHKIGVADDADHKIVGKGKSDDEIILAGNGNNIVKAGGGNDTIHSGAGDDKMVGGAGRDTYVFNTGKTGDDTIVGFSKKDTLEIHDRNGDGKADANDIKSIDKSGQDVVITFADKDASTVKLKDVSLKVVQEHIKYVDDAT
jgi:Ca2+-binding RTX toxin-like protein